MESTVTDVATAPALRPDDSVTIIIDLMNLHGAVTRELGTDKIDFSKLVKLLAAGRPVAEKRIYAVEPPAPDHPFNGFLEKMRRQSFTVVTLKSKLITNGLQKYKCNHDVIIAVDLMDMIIKGRMTNRVILVSGDSDFAPLVEYLRQYGCMVEAVSTYQSLSIELKQAASRYRFVNDFWESIRL